MRYTDWFFTGMIFDHPKKDIACGLCNHERLRYEYVIENRHTQEQLAVGSSCILKFSDIVIYDDQGNIIAPKEEKEKVLKKAFERFNFERSLIPLRSLYRVMLKVDQKKLEGIVKFAKENNSFTPNDLIWLFSAMKKIGIEYHPGFYKVFIRDLSSKIDLKMAIKNPLKLDLIYEVLSASQKKSYGLSERNK